jgi:predicted HicB family RNase H-like nuclease
MIKKIKKETTNLSLDPKIKKLAFLRANQVGQSLSAYITFLIVKELEKKPRGGGGGG